MSHLVNKDKVDDKDINYKTKNLFTFFTSKKSTEADYFIFDAKKTFNLLQNILIEAWIFYYLNIQYHIYIIINMFSYTISEVLS